MEINAGEQHLSPILKTAKEIATEDIRALAKAEESYGDSWKKRGGVGAFMMLARKWDRLETQVSAKNFDVFEAADQDKRPEGILDDIQDLRRYLFLVEAELKGTPRYARTTKPIEKQKP